MNTISRVLQWLEGAAVSDNDAQDLRMILAEQLLEQVPRLKALASRSRDQLAASKRILSRLGFGDDTRTEAPGERPVLAGDSRPSGEKRKRRPKNTENVAAFKRAVGRMPDSTIGEVVSELMKPESGFDTGGKTRSEIVAACCAYAKSRDIMRTNKERPFRYRLAVAS